MRTDVLTFPTDALDAAKACYIYRITANEYSKVGISQENPKVAQRGSRGHSPYGE